MATEAVRRKSNAAAGLAEWAHAVVSGKAAAATSGGTAVSTATMTHEDTTAAGAARKAAAAAPTAWRLGEVRGAFAQLLRERRELPLRRGGIGFLHLDYRRLLISELILAILDVAEREGRDGAAEALVPLLRAQAHSSLSRARGATEVDGGCDVSVDACSLWRLRV